MFGNPFADYRFALPFGQGAMKSTRNLFGTHTTPREWKHGVRDIPFGQGAASLYVNGTDGNDANDGESWKTAKKTIQEAVDTADSWARIFVKAGTYAENVLIGTSKRNIELLGENRVTTSINGAGTSAHALTLNGRNCAVSGFDVRHDSASYHSVSCGAGDLRAIVFDCIIENDSGYGIITGVSTKIFGCLIKGVNIGIRSGASVTYGSEKYTGNEIYNNLVIGDGTTPNIGVDVAEGSHSMIKNNTIVDFVKGIDVSGDDLSIIHNNFINNTTQVESTAARLIARENFYDDHTSVDNGRGIATEPYAFTGGSDLRPVITRDGWKQVSLLRSLLRKKTAAQVTQAATVANGTSWVDLKTIAPTTSDIELHQLKMTVAGSWAGNAKYRVIIGSTKVYPFPADKNISTGVLESFIFPINIQINETAKIQFRSDNPFDRAGDTVTLNQLDYATVL